MKLMISLLILLLSATLYAQTLEKFQAMTDEAKLSFLNKKALFIDNPNQLARFQKEIPYLKTMLKTMGHELSYIWHDTVLEGPYAQTAMAQAELTGIYLYQGKIYAYQGYLSADGVYIGDESCEYNEALKQWSEECPEALIYQRFYMDFTGKFIESDEYAEAE